MSNVTTEVLKCAFTGDRPKTLPWGYNENRPDCVNFKKVLESEIRKLIAKGVMYYISGCAQGTDTIAAEIILKLKNEFTLTLECAIPHEEQAAQWSIADRERYFNIIEKCDKESLLQNHYSRDCYDARNKYMLSKADIVLAVSMGIARSGTGSTIRQAITQGKNIIIINPVTLEVTEM